MLLHWLDNETTNWQQSTWVQNKKKVKDCENMANVGKKTVASHSQNPTVKKVIVA